MFTQSTFAPIGANSAPSPATYSYSTSDPIATVTAQGYFADKQNQLETGDIIIVTSPEGSYILTVNSDTSTAIGSASLVNRVVVSEAADLAGTLDSNKEYFIDGHIDMGTQSIEIPQGGLTLRGYSFDASSLYSTEAGHTLFTSPAGGSGNLLGTDLAFNVSGAGSQVFDIVSDTGFEAVEFNRVNFNNCSSLGTIDNYRQGLESGTGRFGGTPELTLKGAWVGGYFIDTSIVRSLTDGSYTLYKAGAGFTMQSRFRSNQNIDLPANASFFDFTASNFPNPSTIQLVGCIITRDGVSNAEDSNIAPNITASELSCDWRFNNGFTNTFEGGTMTITAEADTLLSGEAIGTFLDAAGTFTASDLQHFDSPVNGQLRHIGNNPREYRLVSDFIIEGTANDEIVVRVAKWDNSASSFTSLYSQTRPINSLAGGRDVGFFSLTTGITLDQNDYIKIELANNTAARDVSVETDSFFTLLER